MVISASSFRRNIYKLLDEALETGLPIEIVRKCQRWRIVPLREMEKCAHLKKHSIMKCSPEELVHLDWSKEWKS